MSSPRLCRASGRLGCLQARHCKLKQAELNIDNTDDNDNIDNTDTNLEKAKVKHARQNVKQKIQGKTDKTDKIKDVHGKNN